MIKKIIILGAPGTGKGTISDLLASKTEIHHISTGSIFRKEIQEQSSLGLQVKTIVKNGGYVPDDITNEIVNKTISKKTILKEGFILDGFPRTINQANYLENNGFNIELAILLEVDNKTIMKRLSGRRTCPLCKEIYHIEFNPPKIENICDKDNTPLIIRSDDQPDKIKKRLEIYKKETVILHDYYQNKKILLKIAGPQNKELIVKQIIERIS